MRRIVLGLSIAVCLAGSLLPAVGGAQRGQVVDRPLRPITMAAVAGPRTFASEHAGVFNGKSVRYRAVVSETIVDAPAGQPAVSMFSTAYVARGPIDAATRPVIFVFNGGPGGSSVFLHLSSMGPKILERTTPDVFTDTTLRLVDNPVSMLDVADLVF